MSEMLKRVARAICKARGGDGSQWERCLPEARAAIGAMRVPTADMLVMLTPWAHEDDPFGEHRWAKMIEAALAETPWPYMDDITLSDEAA